MKIVAMLLMLTTMAFAGGYKVGDKVKGFELKNVDGNMVKLDDYSAKKGVLVVFTCNHCPYAIKYEDRIQALHTEFADDVPVVAINPNAPMVEDDNYENMQVRAKEKGFTFAYLLDADQKVAKTFGAERTPHAYLLKREGKNWVVAYIGAIDDNAGDANAVTKHYLAEAMTAVQTGQAVATPTTKAVGCTIKWIGAK